MSVLYDGGGKQYRKGYRAFGKEKNKGLRLKGFQPEIVEFTPGEKPSADLMVHDEALLEPNYAYLLTQMEYPEMPVPFGVFRNIERPTYDQLLAQQVESAIEKKGKGNSKNGNKYLAWAFSEAAEFFRRYDQPARAFYNRKAAKTNFMVAHTALAHKLCRATYFIIRDEVVYDPDKLFS